jgi:mono/diheme cytochrome c family protein
MGTFLREPPKRVLEFRTLRGNQRPLPLKSANPFRRLWVAIFCLAGLPFTATHRGEAATDASGLKPFLAEHCLRCHGEKKQKGNFRIDTLPRDFASPLAAGHWGEVMSRISSGEMPPDDEPKPKPEEAARAVEWIAGQLKEGEAARLAKRERVTFHKLSREEYGHTIRDLLGVNFNAADPSGLPEDPEWHGFERIGSVLSLSPAHIEKYLTAAETILNEAMPAAAPKTISRRKDVWDLRYHGQQRQKAEQLGLADKARVELWPQDGVDVSTDFPVAGDYRMRIQLSGMKPPRGRAPRVNVYAKGLDRMLVEQDVATSEAQPVTVEVTFHMPAGHQDLRLSCDAPGPSNLPRHGRFDAGRFFTTIKASDTGRQPWQYKLTDEEGVPIRPFLIVDWVEFQGPLQATWPSPQQQQFFGSGAGDVTHAREIVTRFAERAFRRPPREAEVDRFVKLIESELKSGEKFEAAVKSALVAMLCAKDFLYLVEGSADQLSHRLNDWELASRLSYFLWSTMPDDRLLRLARTNALHQPEVLRGEVARMLGDPQAARFATGFARQWLQLRNVGKFPPDKKLYPDYDAHLERSMVAEGTTFFRHVLDQNLSVREFLDSDWTMLNARLAEHYGIAGVEGDVFQRVALRPEHRRGGLLTQAGVLSLTSDGQRHRPVHRGKWVLENIFNQPPPPPPANVSPIEPTPAGQPKATLRMKLQAHIKDPHCASCHRKIDPLGLAFDHYDAIGRWRTEEVVKDGAGENPPVDASGVLPDGRKFADGAELKRLLVADTDKFAAALVEKLATYALRRAMTIDDRRALAALAAQGKATDYRLRDVIEGLVVSELFQSR